MSQRHADMHNKSSNKDDDNMEVDINKILKDIQYLGSSNMSWKERKKLENEKVVSLGGKAPKKHRIPLSVGKFQFKKQKQREEKRMEEERILGRYSRHSSGRGKVEEKRKVEDRVLKASEGHFSKGVLNVKHLLGRKPSEGGDGPPLNKMGGGNGKKKGKGRGKGKGKGKKRGH